MSFAKLFSSITESSLWSEGKETRLMFVTMLAKADAIGHVEASLPGLARVANLTMEEAAEAIKILESPDPHSKDLDEDPSNEGRRILKVKGGWTLINYENYRARRSDDERREYMRTYMQDYRKQRKQSVNTVSPGKPPLAQAEAEAEAEAEAPRVSAPTSPHPDKSGEPNPNCPACRGIGMMFDKPCPDCRAWRIDGGSSNPKQSPNLSGDAALLEAMHRDTAKAQRETLALQIYQIYPIKKGKKPALASIVRDLKAGADPYEILEAVKAFAKAECPKPHASTYFNQRRWEDEDNGKDYESGGFKDNGKPKVPVFQPKPAKPCTLPPDYVALEMARRTKEAKP